jgi:hypothetical protein
MMIEGSRSGAGSGSIPLTNRSRSGRPKNMWIRGSGSGSATLLLQVYPSKYGTYLYNYPSPEDASETVPDDEAAARILNVLFLYRTSAAGGGILGVSFAAQASLQTMFWAPGSGSIIQNYGFGSGSFPFSHKCIERTEIMPAK